MPARIVDVVIGFVSDRAKNQQVIQDTERIQSRIDSLDNSVSNLNQTYGALEDISTRVAAAGAVVFAPLLLSANKYIEAVGTSEKQSREWLKTTERINQSQVNLGRKATEALQPYYSLLADIVQKAGELDPAIVRAGVEIGGVLALVGAAGLLASQVGRLISSTQDLIAGLQKMQLAGGLQGRLATAAVGVGAIGVGTVAGVNIVRGIGRATDDERLAEFDYDDALETIKQILLVVGAVIIDATKNFATIFTSLELAFKLGKIAIEEQLTGLSDTIKKAYLGILKTLADLEIDLGEVLGKDLGSLDIGKQLGLDGEELANQIQAIGENNKNFDEQRKKAADEWVAAMDEFSAEAQVLKQDWLEILGYAEDADEKIKSAAQGFASLPIEQQRALLDAFDQLQTELDNAQKEFHEKRKDDLEAFNEETATIEANFNRQRERATEDFERNRAHIEEDFNRQRTQQQRDFAKQQRDSVTTFNREQAQAAQEFEEGRRKAVEDNRKEDIKRLQDFQRERERAEQDHRQRLLEAVGRLDATAVLQELQGFNRDSSRAGEDFSRETSERQRQLDEQLTQERQHFQEQQQQRTAQFREQQALENQRFADSRARELERYQVQEQRARENFERQQAVQQQDFQRSQNDRRREFNERRNEERREFNALQAERRQAFRSQYNELVNFQNAESRARQVHYQNLQRQLDSFIGGGRPRGTNPRYTIPQFAEGGYLPEGIARTHDGEFALNQRTTRFLEHMAGGKLTQQAVQQMVTNSQSMSIHAPISISGANQSPEAIGAAVRIELKRFLEAYANQ